MMSALVVITVKVSVVLGIGLLTAAALRRRSAALRHAVLAASMIGAATLPALERLVPAWPLPVPSTMVREDRGHAPGMNAGRGGASATTPALAPVPAPPATRALSDVLIAVWLTGALVGLAVLTTGIARLAWLTARATPVTRGPWPAALNALAMAAGVTRRVRLLQTSHPGLLVTWGLRTPSVLLPASAEHWPDERIQLVLRHELAHIARRDWAVQMLALALRTVYWFNPLVWTACTSLRQESERACDDAVLRAGVGASVYASQLVEVARAFRARRQPWLPAPAIVRSSSLERRIRAMLNERLTRHPLTRAARLAVGIGAVSVTLPIAALAQTAFASFSGSVVDPMRAVLPAATLVLTHDENQAKYGVRTDRNGRFEFVGLPPARYRLQVQLPGFSVLQGTVTLAGQDVQQDLTLQLGSLVETVIVGRAAGERPPARPHDATVAAIECRSPAVGSERGVGGNIKPPRPLRRVNPVYPAVDVAGSVVLDGCIGLDGYLRDIRVVSAPHLDLANAAVTAVNQWQFSETLLNGLPVEVAIRVFVDFIP
jgi:beta-lactamase regulating signal transducer with metallopeptidase domain